MFIENLLRASKEYGFDKTDIQKEILSSNTSIMYKKDIASLNERLLKATDESERDSINAQIKQLELEFQQEIEYLNHKYN